MFVLKTQLPSDLLMKLMLAVETLGQLNGGAIRRDQNLAPT